MASSSSQYPSHISTLTSTRGGSVGILTYHSLFVVLHLGKSTTSKGLLIKCVQPSLGVLGKLHLSSSKFLAEHVTVQLRVLILLSPYWMEPPLLPTVLNMVEDIPWHSPFVKDLIMDVLAGQILKGLPYLHFAFQLLRDTCFCRQKFSSSVCQAGAT